MKIYIKLFSIFLRYRKQRENALKALDLLVSRREALVQASTPAEYADALHAARVVLQFVDMQAANANGGEIPSNEARDQAMADNVRWLLEEKFPGQKIVLWAHDGHVGAVPYFGFKTMGTHLRENTASKWWSSAFPQTLVRFVPLPEEKILKL